MWFTCLFRCDICYWNSGNFFSSLSSFFFSMGLYKLSMEKPLGRSLYLRNYGIIIIHFKYATAQDKGPDAHIDV